MTIVAGDWGRRVEITTATTVSTLSGYVALITEDNLPSEIWTLAINGGGDLRVCENSDGTSQLPLEVVSFVTGTNTAELHTRFGSFATGQSFWLFYDKTGETQPAVTATYGRNAVWADYYFITHDIDTDSKGVYNATTNTSTSATGKIGTAAEYNGSQRTVFSSNVLQSNVFSLSFWEFSGNTSGYFYSDGSDITNIFSRRTVSSSISGYTGDVNWDSNGGPFSLSSGVWNLHTLTHDASGNVVVYTNNTGARKSFSGSNFTTLQSDLVIADRASGGRAFTGIIDEYSIRNSVKSSNYISTEYDNQSAPASFWTTGTPENTSSGGVTLDGAFSLPLLTVAGDVTTTLPQPSIAGAFTLPALIAQADGSASLPQPEISGAFSLPLLTVSADGTATLPQPEIAGAFNLPLLLVNGAVTASLPQPSIAGAFSLPALLVNGTGSATTANPEITGAFNLPSLTVSGSATATLPQPEIAGAFSLPALTVQGTGTALIPQPIINGNITLPSLIVSGSGVVTLPQPEISGAFSLPSFIVQGVATVSGLDIILDPKTNIHQEFLNANINQEFLSANISQEFLSNNITYN